MRGKNYCRPLAAVSSASGVDIAAKVMGRFVLALMEQIRKAILEDRFAAFREEFMDVYRPADEAARQRQKEQWLQTRGG